MLQGCMFYVCSYDALVLSMFTSLNHFKPISSFIPISNALAYSG
jgi:hypothetical protein